MKSKFTWIFTLLLAFFIQLSFAQERTISGVVTDTNGMPVPGVTVTVEGSAAGVQTDFDGKYSINASTGQRLVFTFVGMKTQTMTVGASNNIAVQMSEDVKVLDDVVIQAYRSTTKATSNVASTTVTSKTIENRPNASFVQTLQGQIPGLNITSGSGQPGANSLVVLRGYGSINGNIEPLFVIDGVPQSSDSFRSLNPNDIESVSVLKDAGATSIYGNRGANGVIIVKTKRAGYDTNTSVKYTSVTGFNTLQSNKYNIMNSQELLRLERTYGEGRGAGDDRLATDPLRGQPLTDAEIAQQPNTNWLDFFFRTGVTQNHTLSISSGSKNLSAFTTIGYFDQEGILKSTGLKRFNFRSNINGKSEDEKFNYGTSFTANYSRSLLASNLGTGGVNQNYLVGALQGVPYITPADYIDGKDLVGRATLNNTPLFLMDKLNTFTNQVEEMKMIGQAQASYRVLPDVVVGTSLGIDYTQTNGLQVQHPHGFNSLYFMQDDQEFGGTQAETFSRAVIFNTTTNVTYSKTFSEKHNIEVSAFTEYYKAHGKSFSYTQNGLDPIFYSPGTGNGFIDFQSDNVYYVPGVGSAKSEAGLFSYFATADYDYDSKYGLSGSIRRDATYKFTDENKWGTFWSVSARWNIDKEAFMEGSSFDMLKLRGSYGTAGNQDIDGGGIFGAPSNTRLQYGINSGYANNTGYALQALPNRDLRWETIRQANIGLDFSVMNSKLRGNLDVYEKKTIDLYQSIRVSSVNGLTSIPANIGSLRNRGIELALSYDVLKGNDFRVTVNGNGSYNKNELLELPSDNGVIWTGGLTALQEGGKLGQFYLVDYAGVNPANGNLLFYDKNGGVTESPQDADRKFTDKSWIPVYQGGFGLDAEYKGFFLQTNFTFVADVDRFDYDLAGFQDPNDIGLFNKSTDLQRAWTPDNRVTDIPSLYATNLSLDSFSDRNVRDASYIRMRYISLGYTFSPSLLDRTPFSRIKTYVQAENLVTWSKWRGFDAESNRGNDQAQYPTPRIISFGLEFEF